MVDAGSPTSSLEPESMERFEVPIETENGDEDEGDRQAQHELSACLVDLEGDGNDAGTCTSGVGGDGAGTDSAPSPSASCASSKRGHGNSSDVWLFSEPLYHEKDGVKKMYGARCPVYKKILTAPGTGGTGHLGQHQKAFESKHAKATKKQSTFGKNGEGSVSNWVYCPKCVWVELLHLVVRLDLNLGIAERHGAFEEYI